jgi:hypothetical protein
MPTLKEIAERVGIRFKQRSKTQLRASLFVKLALITIGAAAAAIAEAIELARTNHEVSSWTIAGIAASGLVALGGVFVYLTEQDVSETLEDARAALEAARGFEQEKKDFEMNMAWLSNEVTRGLELYNSIDVMRGAIEQSLDLPDPSVASIIDTGLLAARNSLLVAFGFDIKDTWTICIYEACRDAESGKMVLKCIAHDRTVRCSIAEARVWPEGIGVAGIAYSTASEKIIPDMSDPALGTAFQLKTNVRDYDLQRYRSIIAVPIMVGSNKIPWGVAVATSDRPHHFYIEPADGVPTSEPIRAIAAMAALAVKALAKRPSSAIASGTGAQSVGSAAPDDNDKISPNG